MGGIVSPTPRERTGSWLQFGPVRAVFLTLVYGNALLVRLPYLALKFSVPALRPVKGWSWSRSLILGMLSSLSVRRFASAHSDRVDAKILPKLGGDGTPVRIPRLPQPLTGTMGELAQRAGVESVDVHAWWYGESHEGDHKAAQDEKVVLFFHGGGYMEFCAAPACPISGIPRKYLAAARGKPGIPHKVLSLEYRQSFECDFPGFVQDAVAAWRYLVEDCGYKPENIVISGDSAGGNLTLALARYLRDEKPFGGASAKGLILHSPWMSLSGSYARAGPEGSFAQNKHVDMLNAALLQRAAEATVRNLSLKELSSHYWSAVDLEREEKADLKDFPPALVLGGAFDLLRDEGRDLVKLYEAPVTYYEEPLAMHDCCAVPIGFEEEHARVAKRTVEWLTQLWA